MHEVFGRTLRRARAGLLFLVALSSASLLQAQETVPVLRIEIQPAGTAVQLEGPQNTLTASPNSVLRPLPGWYKLKATFRGFEDYNQSLYIDAQSPISISGTLSPKSRWKAGARSIFVPGWGHYYSDRTVRGVVFTVATVGMAVGYYFFDAHADNRLEDYERLREDFDEAGSVAEKEALQPAVEDALNDAYNADRNRLIWGYMTIGVYAYQIIDALLFFPDVPQVNAGPVQMGVTAPLDGTPVMLRASYEF